MSDKSENWRAYEQLISFEKRHDMTYAIRLNQDALNRKFRHPSVKNLPAIIAAFVGETSSGKSTVAERMRVEIMSKYSSKQSLIGNNVSTSSQVSKLAADAIDNHIVGDRNILYPDLSQIERSMREQKMQNGGNSSDDNIEFVDHAELNDDYSNAPTAECQQDQQEVIQKLRKKTHSHFQMNSPTKNGTEKGDGKKQKSPQKRLFGFKKKKATKRNDPMQVICSQGSSDSTQGICIVGPMIVKIDDEPVAFYILDTQGTGDGNNLHNQTQILALKFCSVFILNYRGQSRSIPRTFFMDLRFVMDLAKSIDHNNHNMLDRTINQQFILLLRDWTSLSEHNYGEEGGNNFKNRLIELNKFVDLGVLARFQQSRIWLFPRPGGKVLDAENPNELRRAQYKTEFIEQSGALNNAIISSESKKVLDGKQANCNDIANFFENYFGHFATVELPTEVSNPYLERDIKKQMELEIDAGIKMVAKFENMVDFKKGTSEKNFKWISMKIFNEICKEYDNEWEKLIHKELLAEKRKELFQRLEKHKIEYEKRNQELIEKRKNDVVSDVYVMTDKKEEEIFKKVKEYEESLEEPPTEKEIQAKCREICKNCEKGFLNQLVDKIEEKIIDENKNEMFEKVKQILGEMMKIVEIKVLTSAGYEYDYNKTFKRNLKKAIAGKVKTASGKSTPLSKKEMAKTIAEVKSNMETEVRMRMDEDEHFKKYFDMEDFKKKMNHTARKFEDDNNDTLRMERDKQITATMVQGGLIGGVAGAFIAPAILIGAAAAFPALMPAAAGVAILSTPLRVAASAGVAAAVGGIVGGGGGILIRGKKKNEDAGKGKQK